ncbi:MAG TPA: choice-of-anchor D domain-containing protein, partial [Polyangiaceae bacterium]|nr:choice-of-anchor D domain-containing protein [Polyangiaceae bacterium]
MARFAAFRWGNIFVVALATLLLAGSCSEARLQATNRYYSFGELAIGASAVQTFTVTNTGDADAVIRVVRYLPTYGGTHTLAPPISLEATTCKEGSRIAPGGTCTATVRFAPTEPNYTFGSLEIGYYWQNSAWDRFLLFNFEGSSDGVLFISDPVTFDFGSVSLGSTLTKTFEIANWLDPSVTLADISSDGLGLAAPFTLVGGTCKSGMALTLSPRGRCTVEVAFTSTRLGAATESLDVRYRLAGDSADRVVSRAMQARGVHPDPVQSVAVGWQHTCAVLASGRLHCWGHNRYGELGYGDTRPIGDNEFPTTAGDVNVGGAVQQVALGSGHTCARLYGGELRCWGRNEFGQLGYAHTRSVGDDEVPAALRPVRIGGHVLQLSAGRSHSCVLLAGGVVRCFGDNQSGQLGYGHTRNIG